MVWLSLCGIIRPSSALGITNMSHSFIYLHNCLSRLLVDPAQGLTWARSSTLACLCLAFSIKHDSDSVLHFDGKNDLCLSLHLVVMLSYLASPQGALEPGLLSPVISSLHSEIDGLGFIF